MDSILNTAKSLISLKGLNIDNAVYKLFYKVSVGLCLIGTIVLGCKQYFGDPIECFQNHGLVDGDVFESYCWLHGSTHLEGTLRETSKCISQAKKVNIKSKSSLKEILLFVSQDDTEFETGYYQWVVFLLALNALVFRIPYTIWKFSEGGLLKKFCPQEDSNDVEALATVTQNQAERFRQNRDDFGKYYAIFQITQLLNVAMVFFNFLINNSVLFGLYFKYGFEWLNYDPTDEGATDPLCNVFPTTVSCSMEKGGSNGKIETASGLCTLSQNIINEKTYLILWFWFVFLLTVGLLQILLELAYFFIPAMRVIPIKWQIGSLLTENIKIYLHSLGISDWFFLCQIGKNTNKEYFSDLLKNLAQEKNVELVKLNETE